MAHVTIPLRRVVTQVFSWCDKVSDRDDEDDFGWYDDEEVEAELDWYEEDRLATWFTDRAQQLAHQVDALDLVGRYDEADALRAEIRHLEREARWVQ